MVDRNSSYQTATLMAVALFLGWIFTLIGPLCVDCSPTGNCQGKFRELGFQFVGLVSSIVPSAIGFAVLAALRLRHDHKIPLSRSALSANAILVFVALVITNAIFHELVFSWLALAFVYTFIQLAQLLMFLTVFRFFARKSAAQSSMERFHRGLKVWIAGMAIIQLVVGLGLYLRETDSCSLQGLSQEPSTSIIGYPIEVFLFAGCALAATWAIGSLGRRPQIHQ